MTICDQFQDIVPFYSLQMSYIKLQEYPHSSSSFCLSQKNRMKDKDFQNFPPMPPNHHQRRRFQLMFFMMAECRMHTARSQEGSSSLFIQVTFTFTACNVCHELYLEWCSKASSSHPSGNTQDTALSLPLRHSYGGEPHHWVFLYFCRLLLLLLVLIFLFLAFLLFYFV